MSQSSTQFSQSTYADEYTRVDVTTLVDRLAQHIRTNRSHYTSLVIVPEQLQAELRDKLAAKLGKRLSAYVTLRDFYSSISFLNSCPPIEKKNVHQRICDEVLSALEYNDVDVPHQLDHLLYTDPDSVAAQAYHAALATSDLQHPYILAQSTHLPVTVKDVFVYGMNTLHQFERSWLINLCSAIHSTFSDSAVIQGPTPNHSVCGQETLLEATMKWIRAHPGSLIYTDSISLRDRIDYQCLRQGIRSTVTGQGGLYDCRELHNLKLFAAWLRYRSPLPFEELYALTGFTPQACSKAMSAIGLVGSIHDNRLRTPADRDSQPLLALSNLTALLSEIDALDRDLDRITVFNDWMTTNDSTLRPEVIAILLSGVARPLDWVHALAASSSDFTNHQLLSTIHNPYPIVSCDVLLVTKRYSSGFFVPSWDPAPNARSTFTIFEYSLENTHDG